MEKLIKDVYAVNNTPAFRKKIPSVKTKRREKYAPATEVTEVQDRRIVFSQYSLPNVLPDFMITINRSERKKA